MPDYPRLDPNGLLYYTQELVGEIEQDIDDATPDLTGATDQTNGARGLAPQPNAGQHRMFLRGDGVWADPVGTPNTIESISVNGTNVPPDQNKNVNITVPTKTSDLTNDSDFQTGTQVDNKIDAAISSVYKPGGDVTFATLPALSAANSGYVYNVTDAFTTTADFVEGAGKSYGPGTDVAIVDRGTVQNPVYKYNVMPGFIDLSGYVLRSNMTTITNQQIDDIIDSVFNPSSGT